MYVCNSLFRIVTRIELRLLSEEKSLVLSQNKSGSDQDLNRVQAEGFKPNISKYSAVTLEKIENALLHSITEERDPRSRTVQDVAKQNDTVREKCQQSSIGQEKDPRDRSVKKVALLNTNAKDKDQEHSSAPNIPTVATPSTVKRDYLSIVIEAQEVISKSNKLVPKVTKTIIAR